MTQRISRRTGKRYAEGSHTTWEAYPRVCSGCGEKLTLKLVTWIEAAPGEPLRSWHFKCRLKKGV